MLTARGTSYKKKKQVETILWYVKAQVCKFKFEAYSLKHQKQLISFVIYVHLRARTHQCGSH